MQRKVFCSGDDELLHGGGFCYGGFYFREEVRVAVTALKPCITRNDRDAAYQMLGWFAWAVLYLVAAAASNGAEANVFCDVYDSKQDYEEKYCQGYGAATVFYVFAIVITLAAVGSKFIKMEKFQGLLFYLSWALFYLGYACYAGGTSAANCQLEKDDKSNVDYLVRMVPRCLLVKPHSCVSGGYIQRKLQRLCSSNIL